MKVSETYPSAGQWLKAADMVGCNVIAKISGIDVDTFNNPDGSSQTRFVLSFEGQEKGLVVSPTNARTLAETFGDETGGWLGKAVQITTRQYDINGNKTHGFIIMPARAPEAWGQKGQAPVGGSVADPFNDDIPI